MPHFNITFIKKPVKWFLKKKGQHIVINTELESFVRPIAESDTVNFIDCLMICSLHYLKQLTAVDVLATPIDVLETLKAPFYNRYIEDYLYDRLYYTPKENYQNLNIADDLEFYFKYKQGPP